MIDRLFCDFQAGFRAERATAVTIHTFKRIDEIRRIGNDHVELSAKLLEQVAFDDMRIADSIQQRINSAEAQGASIDIAEHYGRERIRPKRSRMEAASSGAQHRYQEAAAAREPAAESVGSGA